MHLVLSIPVFHLLELALEDGCEFQIAQDVEIVLLIGQLAVQAFGLREDAYGES